ncbi:hypothetical protein D1610_12790 [Sphingomonas gilva]|uniref:Uncharacterized protein n=1 Tax=Sphingomonas gilva TaxID=2305907 RepID=A0A396RL55_9SPHN|nr:hypothetical protein D1610_12790 [Sphingomonas gilva]
MSLEMSEAALSLSYTATNKIDETLFLLDGLHDEIGNEGILPMRDAPWVEFAADSVTLSRKLIMPPPDIDVETLNYPLPTRLPPGQSHQGRMTVGLPLLPATPYRRYRASHRPVVEQRPLFFELGFIRGRPGLESIARPVNTSEGPRPAFPSIDEQGQLVARLGPLGTIGVMTNAVED